MSLDHKPAEATRAEAVDSRQAEIGITVADLSRLEQLGADEFRADPLPTTLGRTFGGQVAAQAVAAAGTCTPSFAINSLHAYFMRGGDPLEPTTYRVERVRDGRTFATRRVSGWQHGREIFTMIASFHRGDEGFVHGLGAPRVPDPEELPREEQGERARLLGPERAWWDRREIPPPDGASFPVPQRVWVRYRGEVAASPLAHAVALTYVSDMGLVRSAHGQHPGHDREVQNASLDHSLWFHRPFRVDEWMLYDQGSPVAHGGRALTTASIFDRSGTLVATANQEALVRYPSR